MAMPPICFILCQLFSDQGKCMCSAPTRSESVLVVIVQVVMFKVLSKSFVKDSF